MVLAYCANPCRPACSSTRSALRCPPGAAGVTTERSQRASLAKVWADLGVDASASSSSRGTRSCARILACEELASNALLDRLLDEIRSHVHRDAVTLRTKRRRDDHGPAVLEGQAPACDRRHRSDLYRGSYTLIPSEILIVGSRSFPSSKTG